MGVRYCTREEVLSALDDSARSSASVDRACESASRAVEHLTHRRFYPEIATKYYDWPNQQHSSSYRLWLDDDLLSATSITAGGALLTNYFLEPANDGPPYNCLETNLSSSSVFGSGSTHQRAIAITGSWGADDTQVPAGATAEALDDVETEIDITNGAVVDVGDLLLIDTERLLVTERTWLTSGQTGSLTADKAAVTLAVSSGAAFNVGERLLIDAEELLITAVAGNNLVVKRAQAGTVLAVHSTATVYTSRTLTVARGVLGTTAATHLTAAAITRLDPPAEAREYALALAINRVLQEAGGYSQSTGSGETKADAVGGGLDALRRQCYDSLARKARSRAV